MNFRFANLVNEPFPRTVKIETNQLIRLQHVIV
jgi:hypothetical protein